jgi:tRNA (cytidine32/uridine32-2'-O)-methyltransferase
MRDLLNHIRIVLVETSHPGNIGAAARAMKTMGLKRLMLVRPQHYPSAEATARASGADDVLARAEVCDSLEQAIADCVLVIGSSARERRLEWAGLTPPESAVRLLEFARQGEVALVFGRERTGLSNEELACCQQLVTIDANPAYSSLNLAAAVQVFCYEVRKRLSESRGTTESGRGDYVAEQAATSAQLEGLFGHFEEALFDIGVAQPEQPKATLMLRLRRLFYRAGLSETEVNILRGILSAAQGRKQKRANK